MNEERFLWFFTALGELKFKIEINPKDNSYGRAWRGLWGFDRTKVTLRFNLWQGDELPIISIHNDCNTRTVYTGHLESKEMLEMLLRNIL